MRQKTYHSDICFQLIYLIVILKIKWWNIVNIIPVHPLYSHLRMKLRMGGLLIGHLGLLVMMPKSHKQFQTNAQTIRYELWTKYKTCPSKWWHYKIIYYRVRVGPLPTTLRPGYTKKSITLVWSLQSISIVLFTDRKESLKRIVRGGNMLRALQTKV